MDGWLLEQCSRDLRRWRKALAAIREMAAMGGATHVDGVRLWRLNRRWQLATARLASAAESLDMDSSPALLLEHDLLGPEHDEDRLEQLIGDCELLVRRASLRLRNQFVHRFAESIEQWRAATNEKPPARGDSREKIGKAIAMLMSDVHAGQTRSDRQYADACALSPSTLSRNKGWKQAKEGAKRALVRPNDAEASRDAEGCFEAWRPTEPCENCGDADPKRGPLLTRVIDGQAHHVCETCAQAFSRNLRNTKRNTSEQGVVS